MYYCNNSKLLIKNLQQLNLFNLTNNLENINKIYFINCIGDSIQIINNKYFPNLNKIFLINYSNNNLHEYEYIKLLNNNNNKCVKILSNNIFFQNKKKCTNVEYLTKFNTDKLINLYNKKIN